MEEEAPLVIHVKGTCSTQGQLQVTAHATGMTAVSYSMEQPCFATRESAICYNKPCDTVNDQLIGKKIWALSTCFHNLL